MYCRPIVLSIDLCLLSAVIHSHSPGCFYHLPFFNSSFPPPFLISSGLLQFNEQLSIFHTFHNKLERKKKELHGGTLTLSFFAPLIKTLYLTKDQITVCNEGDEPADNYHNLCSFPTASQRVLLYSLLAYCFAFGADSVTVFSR